MLKGKKKQCDNTNIKTTLEYDKDFGIIRQGV